MNKMAHYIKVLEINDTAALQNAEYMRERTLIQGSKC